MMTSRLSESDSASPRQTAEIASATRSPQSGEVERLPVRVEHAEVVQVTSPSPCSRVGTSSTTASPRCSRIGRKSDSLHLARRLVEPDAGQVLLLPALVLQTDGERLAGIEPLELLDVEEREVDVGRRLVVVGEVALVLLGERVAPLLAVERDEPLAQPVVPGAGDATTTSCSSSANETSGIVAVDVDGEVDPRLLLVAEREVVVDRRAVEALEEQLLEPLAQLGVEAVARQRDEHGDPLLVEVAGG